MITLNYHGGLGNTLFQYCFARILHENTGLKVQIHKSSYTQHLTKKTIIRENLGINGFPNTFTPLVGRSNVNLTNIYVPTHNSINKINPDFEEKLNIEHLCNQLQKNNCVLSGFFQRYEYYVPWKSEIKNWLITDISLKNSPGEDDLVVYVQSYFNIPPSFFAQTLKKLKFKKLYLLVNDIKRAEVFIRALDKYVPIIVHSIDPLHDFEFLRRAKRAVIAPSSFSWWACWLSSAERIITAVPDVGFGSKGHLLSDLAIHDEIRYEYIPINTQKTSKKMKNIIRKLFKNKSRSFHRVFKHGRKIPVLEQILGLRNRILCISNIKTFVETGTNEGETIETASAYFPKCITIELSKELYEKVSKRLEHTDIIFEYGDSTIVLARLAEEIKEPAIFYLDAHFSGGDTARGNEDVPLLNEVAILGKRSFSDIIIIDDASLFGYSQKESLNEDWSKITVKAILDAFGKENSQYIIENDRMILWRLK
jgi:hypothetical protein